MKKKKTLSPIMVSISAFALNGLCAAPVFAQIVVNCGVGLSIGKNAQCSDTAELLINPDGSTSLKSGCIVTTVPVKAGQCTIKTSAPNTKSVKVDFAKTFVNLKNGVNTVLVDSLRMQYTATVPPASKFTFSATAVSNTVTIDIGGTVNITPSETLGAYSGTVTVRANPI